MKKFLKIFAFLIAFILLIFLVSAAYFYQWFNNPLSTNINNENDDKQFLSFRIPYGVNLRQAIKIIQNAGVQNAYELPLLAIAKYKKIDKNIKAGTYLITEDELKILTPDYLLQKLVAGKVVQNELKIIEGENWFQIKNKIKNLQQQQKLADDIDLDNENDLIEIAQKFDLPNSYLEGWLFPDTYLFDSQSKTSTLISFAISQMQKEIQKVRLNDNFDRENYSYNHRLDSDYKLLILASIIEKETAHPDDRFLISSVFNNRLKINMKLQTDPTVIYGILFENNGYFSGNLSKKDLSADTIYNTYTRFGLPPTPIAMPSRASLEAALNPAKSNFLYFVSKGDGDGKSYFSENLQQHNNAVNLYQRKIKNNAN